MKFFKLLLCFIFLNLPLIGSFQLHKEYPQKCAINCLASSLDDKLVSGSQDGNLVILDLATDQSVSALRINREGISCFTELENDLIAIALISPQATINIYRKSTLECFKIIKTDQSKITCLIDLGEGKIATAASNIINIWDINTGSCLKTLEEHTANINCLINMGKNRIVSGSDDGTIKIWYPSSKDSLRTLEGHTGSVRCLTNLGEGKIVSGSSDGTMKIWITGAGDCIRTLTGHKGDINCLVTLIEERACVVKFISGSVDGSMKVWTEYGCVQELPAHSSPINCLTILSGGKIASGSDDCILKIWERVSHGPRSPKKRSITTIWPFSKLKKRTNSDN